MSLQMQINYPREVNWDSHTATLRTLKKSHQCFICKEYIMSGSKAYSIVTWGAGLAGKKFPTYVHPEHLEDYRRDIPS